MLVAQPHLREQDIVEQIPKTIRFCVGERQHVAMPSYPVMVFRASRG